MKTTKDYLNKTSKHLFKFSSDANYLDTYYMKVIVRGNSFYKLKFNEELELIETEKYNFEETVSSAGKTYVPTELKNWTLFYRDMFNGYNISSIKHFKKIKGLINEETMKIDKELEKESVSV